MTKRWFTRFFLACTLASFFIIPTAQAEETVDASVFIKPVMQKKPVVFILPHQDDELFMAGAIQQYKKTGRAIYVVMVSDGGSSAARHVLNGKDEFGNPVFCDIHERFHRPAKEGYRIFTRQTFSAARNKEFVRSLKELGIPKSHIYFMNKGGENGSAKPEFRDGDLTRNAAEALMRIYKKYGDGTYITVSGGHRDHIALEEALIQTDGITEKLFFPLEHDHVEAHVQLSSTEAMVKQKAVGVYEEWAPKKGIFGIGGHSVKGFMTRWRAEDKEFYYSIY